MNDVNDCPGSSGLPLIGEAFEIFLSPQKFYLDRYHQFNQYYRTKILNKNTLVLFGDKARHFALKENAEIISSYKGWSLLEEFLGHGILLQDGEEHQISRKIIGAAFSNLSTENIIESIERSAKRSLSCWESKSWIHLFPELRRFTLEVVINLVFGRDHAEERIKKLQNLFALFVDGQLDIFRIDIPLTMYGKAKRSKIEILQYVNSEIQRVRSEGFDSSGILGFILEKNNHSFISKPLNDYDLTVQISLILFAGYETSAVFIFWLLFSIHKHPNILNNIQNEFSSNEFSIEKLLYSCKILDFSLLECERLFPPVTAIPRGLFKSCTFEDIFIPDSWDVHISPLISHRIESVFTNPDSFFPTRFEDGDLKGHLFGFGAGRHRCLGKEIAKLEAKILLILLMKDFNFSFAPKLSFDKATYESSIYLKKLFLKLESRSKN